jgi:hypothetical protein
MISNDIACGGAKSAQELISWLTSSTNFKIIKTKLKSRLAM